MAVREGQILARLDAATAKAALTLADALLMGSLIILMVVKFALVVLWFMHLKFDSRLYLRLFVAGLVLALAVFSVAFAFAFGS